MDSFTKTCKESADLVWNEFLELIQCHSQRAQKAVERCEECIRNYILYHMCYYMYIVVETLHYHSKMAEIYFDTAKACTLNQVTIDLYKFVACHVCIDVFDDHRCSEYSFCIPYVSASGLTTKSDFNVRKNHSLGIKVLYNSSDGSILLADVAQVVSLLFHI